MRCAVIGLGVGRSHAEAYASLPETELVAVSDANEARLRPVAEGHGCRAYTDVEAPLAEREIELVSVATPHPSHAELVDALKAGRRPLVDGVEGRKSVAILLAIYESARTGQPVRLTEPAAV
jgi:predicted dehydrogenase